MNYVSVFNQMKWHLYVLHLFCLNYFCCVLHCLLLSMLHFFSLLQALHGVYAKDVHVRMACLNAVKCIPAVSTRSLSENIEVSTSLWIAVHDPEKVWLLSVRLKSKLSLNFWSSCLALGLH